MAETSKSLRRILERIRDDAQQALSVLGNSEEQRMQSRQTFHATRAGRSRAALSEVRERVFSGVLTLHRPLFFMP